MKSVSEIIQIILSFVKFRKNYFCT